MTTGPNALFFAMLEQNGLPLPEPEYRFAPPRRWRFDYAWPVQRLALEVEGGVWTKGRHTRGAGFLRDVEKYNAAAVDFWRVLRTTPDKLVSLKTVELLKLALLPPEKP